MIPVGARAELTFSVSDSDTAIALGSGDVPVLATPRLIAWIEAATVAAVAGYLEEGDTTVGTAVDVQHVSSSHVGTMVTVTAEVEQVTGRQLRFTVRATNSDGVTAMLGSVTRVQVPRARFLPRS